jgi:hypothetical protein
LRIAAFCCELIRSVAVTTIPSHILGMDTEIDKGLAAFIATLQGPLGQIPFERAVVRHLPLFLGLRQRGLTWTRVASLLTARGVRRADGHPISVEQLRGVVSRQIRRTGLSASDRTEPVGLADRSQATRKSLSATKHKRDGQPAAAKQPRRGCLQPIDKAPSAVERPDDIRAFMGRAARLGAVSTTQFDEKVAAAIRRLPVAALVRGV